MLYRSGHRFGMSQMKYNSCKYFASDFFLDEMEKEIPRAKINLSCDNSVKKTKD